MKLKDIDTETLIRSVSLESGRKSKQKGKKRDNLPQDGQKRIWADYGGSELLWCYI